MSRFLRSSLGSLAIAATLSFAGCGTSTPGDTDQDGVLDVADNCPNRANANQADPDLDGFGSLCDNCPNNANADQTDADSDGSGAACDSNDLNPFVQ